MVHDERRVRQNGAKSHARLEEKSSRVEVTSPGKEQSATYEEGEAQENDEARVDRIEEKADEKVKRNLGNLDDESY